MAMMTLPPSKAAAWRDRSPKTRSQQILLRETERRKVSGGTVQSNRSDTSAFPETYASGGGASQPMQRQTKGDFHFEDDGVALDRSPMAEPGYGDLCNRLGNSAARDDGRVERRTSGGGV